MASFSALPAKPYFHEDDFPELKVLKENWQTIRQEAEQLQDHIKRPIATTMLDLILSQTWLETFLFKMV